MSSGGFSYDIEVQVFDKNGSYEDTVPGGSFGSAASAEEHVPGALRRWAKSIGKRGWKLQASVVQNKTLSRTERYTIE